MTPTMKRLFGTALALAAGLAAAAPALSSAQRLADHRPLHAQPWSRWERVPGTVGSPSPAASPQDSIRGSDGRVLAFSTLGAAAGGAVGALLGAGACYNGCGDDEADAVFAALALGMAGGGVGSTLAGCSVAGESRCARRVMPKALLGSLAATAIAVAVVSTTESGLSALVAFSVVQGLLTTMTIR